METKPTHQRRFTGTVVSVAMNKTIVVSIDRTKVHSKYEKQFVRSKKYHVHDAHGGHVVGQQVTFVECRPLSKTKRWRVVTPVTPIV